MKKQFTFIDLFSGIGGFRKGFEKVGFKCIGWCEFDPHAQKTYRANYDTEGEWFSSDIRTVESADIARLRPDAICFGFPCQDISVAGKGRGFFKDGEDGEKELTRSGLFFEVVRILAGMSQEDRPKWLFCENVKNLLSIDAGIGCKGSGFLRVLLELDALGYDAEWQVFNTKNSYIVGDERTRTVTVVDGIPQNRERVYIIARKRSGNRCRRKVLPIPRASEEDIVKLQQIGKMGGGYQFDNPTAYRVYSRQGLAPTLNCCGGVDTSQTSSMESIPSNEIKVVGNYSPSNYSASRVVSADGIAPTVMENHGTVTGVVVNQNNWGGKLSVRPVLTPDRENARQCGRRIKEDGEPLFTLTAQDRHGVAIQIKNETDTNNNAL